MAENYSENAKNNQVQVVGHIFLNALYNDILSNCEGTVELTREVYIPHPTSVEAEMVKRMPRGSLWFRYYVNVLPKKSQFPSFSLKAVL